MTDIKYFVVSDIHLGNKRNKTVDIVYNFKAFIDKYNSKLKDIDILFIAGDLFDDLIDFSQPEAYVITEFLLYIINYCVNNNIRLRVLEGTPSHDWKQSRIIGSLISGHNINIDYKYIEKITIEYMSIKDRIFSVLYIPDESHPTSDMVYTEVLNILTSNNLEKVDICIMHGLFNYQLPYVHSPLKHTEQHYLDITRYFIHIGHIHVRSNYDRIYAQGSFDRLSYNEEEPKGGYLVTLSSTPTIEFLVNDLAKLFITIDVDKLSSLEEIDSLLSKIRKYSYVRLVGTEDRLKSIDVQQLNLRYIDLTISKKTLKDEKLISYNEIDTLYTELNSTTLRKLIEEQLSNIENCNNLIISEFLDRALQGT